MDATATTVFPQFGSASGTGVMNAAAPMVKKLASTSSRLSVAVSVNFILHLIMVSESDVSQAGVTLSPCELVIFMFETIQENIGFTMRHRFLL